MSAGVEQNLIFWTLAVSVASAAAAGALPPADAGLTSTTPTGGRWWPLLKVSATEASEAEKCSGGRGLGSNAGSLSLPATASAASAATAEARCCCRCCISGGGGGGGGGRELASVPRDHETAPLAALRGPGAASSETGEQTTSRRRGAEKGDDEEEEDEGKKPAIPRRPPPPLSPAAAGATRSETSPLAAGTASSLGLAERGRLPEMRARSSSLATRRKGSEGLRSGSVEGGAGGDGDGDGDGDKGSLPPLLRSGSRWLPRSLAASGGSSAGRHSMKRSAESLMLSLVPSLLLLLLLEVPPRPFLPEGRGEEVADAVAARLLPLSAAAAAAASPVPLDPAPPAPPASEPAPEGMTTTQRSKSSASLSGANCCC